jgi:hypothetical protein
MVVNIHQEPSNYPAMSFGESVFSAGFNQKTGKEDQNVK